jgi:DNA polymerase-3 subunit beta
VKFTVAHAALAAALKRVAPLAPADSTVPILSTVRIEAGLDGLVVTTTDFDRWLSERVDDEPRPDWAGCVAAEKLHELTKSLRGGGEIGLEATDERTLKIVNGRVTAKLGVLPASDFPRAWARRDDAPVTCELAAAALLAAVKFCSHLLSEPDDKSGRYWLQGIHLGDDGVVAGTDGNRLAVFKLAGLSAPAAGIILPTLTAKRLAALLRETESTVAVTLTGHLAIFAGDRWELRSKLIDGAFPNYRRALLARSAAPVVVDRAALAAATDRVKLMIDGLKESKRSLRLTVEAGALTVTSSQPDAAIEEVIALAGEPTPAALEANAIYLAEGLKALDGNVFVELHLSDDPYRPFWLTAEDEPHDGITLVPMR